MSSDTDLDCEGCGASFMLGEPHFGDCPADRRPLLVVHRIAVDRVFTTVCGRFAGQRRWDADLGRTVQDTGRYSLGGVRLSNEVECGECSAGAVSA